MNKHSTSPRSYARKVLVFATFSLCACISTTPPPPAPPSDGDCAAACTNMQRLGCDGASGSPSGASCAQACEELEREGIVSLHTECVSAARTCDEVNACVEDAP